MVLQMQKCPHITFSGSSSLKTSLKLFTYTVVLQQILEIIPDVRKRHAVIIRHVVEAKNPVL